MAFDPQKVIAVAKAEIGYLEKKSDSQLDDKTANAGSKNYTKYARDLDALGFYNGKKQGVAWCDVFNDWCFYKAYGFENMQKMTFQAKGKSNSGAGCKYSRNYYKKNGRLFDKPQPGDQIFFYDSALDDIAHTGIVVKVDNTYVYTVEGNTSSDSGVVANGGCVRDKKYKLSFNRIAGYGRPDYGITASTTTTTTTTTTETKEEAGKKYATVTGGSVNIRSGDSTKYGKIATLKKGAKYEYVASSVSTGWHAIRYDGKIAWISNKYSTVK